MRYLKNPTNKKIEFLYGGQHYTVNSGDTVGFADEDIVEHCTKFVNTKLVEVNDPEKETTNKKK